MQNILNKIRIQILLILLPAITGCASAKERKVDESTLVHVAIVKLVNVSKQPLYEYLSDSLTEAARTSMQKKFSYHDIPAAKTADVFADLEKRGGVTDAGQLRSRALAIDADLFIYGYYTISAGKKGDSAEIIFNVFRADKGLEITRVSRKAVISGAVFKEIDALAAEVVAAIGAYRKSQMAGQGGINAAETSGEKIPLTRDSLNILPFIPPVF